MLDNLTNRLARVMKTLKGEARLTESNIADALREVRMALLEADVSGCVALRYVDNHGKVTEAYPANPNGSEGAIAGICNETGRLFGLMPHPEAYLHRTNHPRWTRECLPEEGQGITIFRNAVTFIRSKEF